MRARSGLAFFSLLLTGGCAVEGAPSFVVFGAYFPAWMFCGLATIAAAILARAVMTATGLSNVLPYQLFVCAALGVMAGLALWFSFFGS